MSVIVSDNFVDTAGTSVTAHTPGTGGPIVSAAANSAAVITAANRLRGNYGVGFSYFSYSANPINAFYTVEAIVYPVSLVNGFGITARQAAGSNTGGTGIIVNYAASSTRWTIAGPGISGDDAFKSYTVGSRLHCQLVFTPGLCTFAVNGVNIFTRTVTGTPIIGLAGIVFSAQDTDLTGFQFENFSVNDSEGGALCATDAIAPSLVAGSTAVTSSLGATPSVQPSLSAGITIECAP